MISPSAEEYLETIYRLGEDGEDALVPLADLAAYLDVSVVSANRMARRLEERGLLTYTPYRGVILSRSGRTQAASLLRRHRLWERFLRDVLGLPWEQVHEEACRLEHATSPAVEEGLARFLENPRTCPHGHAMPDQAGDVPSREGHSLAQAEPGQRVRILNVAEEDPSLLSYVADLGLLPGVQVYVAERSPVGGVLTIRVGEREHAIGSEVARQIYVQPYRGQE